MQLYALMSHTQYLCTYWISMSDIAYLNLPADSLTSTCISQLLIDAAVLGEDEVEHVTGITSLNGYERIGVGRKRQAANLSRASSCWARCRALSVTISQPSTHCTAHNRLQHHLISSLPVHHRLTDRSRKTTAPPKNHVSGRSSLRGQDAPSRRPSIRCYTKNNSCRSQLDKTSLLLDVHSADC